MKVLVVGAGFAGAVVARECADAGMSVTVVDRLPYVGGSAADHVVDGIRQGRHGAHLFQTSNTRVVRWLDRFTDWVPYRHKSVCRFDDETFVPFPLNADSMRMLVDRGLGSVPKPGASGPPGSALKVLAPVLSPDIIERFFGRYVNKMWDLPLDRLPGSIVRRVMPRRDRSVDYFSGAKFQALPADGYTSLFQRMLAHPNITLRLGAANSRDDQMAADFVFSSQSIDSHYGYRFGTLRYRSIRFHTRHCSPLDGAGHVTINRTDQSRITRETYWHNLPGHVLQAGIGLVTCEEPCDWTEAGRFRHYPAETLGGVDAEIYATYAAHAATDSDRIRFVGRCGTYRYLNMDQVIMQSLQTAHHWLAMQNAAQPSLR